MTDDDLIGLRDEDLMADERRRRDALLADPAWRRIHEEALRLGARVARLPDAPPRFHAPEPVRLLGVGLSSVAAAAIVVLWFGTSAPPPTLRARGSGTDAPTTAVVLRAAAEGAHGPRRLDVGARVTTGEGVVFEVETPSPGELLVEQVDGSTTARVWPREGETWTVGAGRHLVGGERPQAWRPDRPGTHRYRATFCPADGGDCVRSELDLEAEAR